MNDPSTIPASQLAHTETERLTAFILGQLDAAPTLGALAELAVLVRESAIASTEAVLAGAPEPLLRPRLNGADLPEELARACRDWLSNHASATLGFRHYLSSEN